MQFKLQKSVIKRNSIKQISPMQLINERKWGHGRFIILGFILQEITEEYLLGNFLEGFRLFAMYADTA